MSKNTMSVEEAIRELLEDHPEDIWCEEKDVDKIMENLDEIVDEEGQVLDLQTYEVISFIQNNYTEITGNSESDMYAEQEFDWEVTEIARICGIDYDSLCENW